MKDKLLKTPQGAESIFLDEAYKHEKINEAINDIYTRWGYLPIKTPVFDYYETFEKLLSTENKKNCFRLMDRDGEILLLRNDITLFLARQLGRVASKGDVLRVHYADSILRHQSEIDISSNEFFQTGAELVGAEGLFGDLEAITLLHKIISDLNIEDTTIHIGSRSILDRLTNSFESIDSKKLISLINLRDNSKISEYLTEFMDSNSAKQITAMFMFIGTISEFNNYININKQMIEAMNFTDEFNYLSEIAENLAEIGIGDDFRLDLSEVANRDYYTGVVFQAYTKDIDSAIASGGRYDQLISRFGEAIPSVGFSILLRKIESKIHSDRFTPPEISKLNENKRFSELYKAAEDIRNSGGYAITKGSK